MVGGLRGLDFFFFESQIRLLFSDGKERSAKRRQVFAVRFTLQEEGAPTRQTDSARVSDAFWVTVLSYADGVLLRVGVGLACARGSGASG